MVQDNVLAYLEKHRGEVVTGGQIARQLGVSRNSVWKAVHALQKKGHDIEAMANSGYCLVEASDGLSATAIKETLTTESFGRELELLETVVSTNSFLKGLDTAALPEGYTVLADEQTAGRGRLGRTFYSPAREGVYLSVLLKPRLAMDDVPMLTICAAVAVSAAVEKVCGLQTGVKWVNDIYCNGKKLCGILSEAFISAELKTTEYVIVGIGINSGKVDPAVADIATSIFEETSVQGIRNRLAAEILNQFEYYYKTLLTENGCRTVLEEYRRRLFIVGRKVEVLQHNTSYTATVLGIDDAGALLVKTAGGEQEALRTGEIRLTQ